MKDVLAQENMFENRIALEVIQEWIDSETVDSNKNYLELLHDVIEDAILFNCFHQLTLRSYSNLNDNMVGLLTKAKAPKIALMTIREWIVSEDNEVNQHYLELLDELIEDRIIKNKMGIRNG